MFFVLALRRSLDGRIWPLRREARCARDPQFARNNFAMSASGESGPLKNRGTCTAFSILLESGGITPVSPRLPNNGEGDFKGCDVSAS
jgi:hypothetical protein